MTISQSLVLTLLIAMWSTGNGVNLANNTTLLLILLIALISLSLTTNSRYRRCQTQLENANNGIFDNNFLNNF